MNDMTTQEMVEELTMREGVERLLSKPTADAIAARLKALEEALRWYEGHCRDVNRRGERGDIARSTLADDAGETARAILDTVREGS